jgi:hypothetical protein
MLSWRKKTAKESSNATDKGDVIRKMLEEKRKAVLNASNESPTMLIFLKKIKVEQEEIVRKGGDGHMVDEILGGIKRIEETQRELFEVRCPVWEINQMVLIIKELEDGLKLARENAAKKNDRMLIEKCNTGIIKLEELFKEIAIRK